MKIPRQLNIKGAHWSVVVTNTLRYKEGVDILGLCDPSVRTIFIYKKQTKRQILATFAHEFLHAWEYEHNKNIGHRTIEKVEVPMADFLVSVFSGLA